MFECARIEPAQDVDCTVDVHVALRDARGQLVLDGSFGRPPGQDVHAVVGLDHHVGDAAEGVRHSRRIGDVDQPVASLPAVEQVAVACDIMLDLEGCDAPCVYGKPPERRPRKDGWARARFCDLRRPEDQDAALGKVRQCLGMIHMLVRDECARNLAEPEVKALLDLVDGDARIQQERRAAIAHAVAVAGAPGCNRLDVDHQKVGPSSAVGASASDGTGTAS